MFTEIFGRLLQEKGVTAYAVSKETGISKGLMENYKNGNRNPTGNNLTKIADYFNVSTDYLLGRTIIPLNGINGDVLNSAIAQGNYSKAINEHNELSKEENELINSYRTFDFKKRLALLNKLVELQQDQ